MGIENPDQTATYLLSDVLHTMVDPRHDRPYLRLSIQGYNTRADIDRLVEALAHLLPPRSPVGPASLGG